MTEISKEEFKQSVVDNLKMLFRRSVEDADQQQLFQAVAYATKDIVVDQWMASHKEFEKQDKKIVYYLSMEFLMGRALGNIIINLKGNQAIKEAIEELLDQVEPEYFYTEEDVKNLLENGSLDALKDCLDYAPIGTIDLVKKLAVELPLNDVAKREAILEMTGFNIDSAIMVNKATQEDKNNNEHTIRRVNTTQETVSEKPTGRRTEIPATNGIKIISK